MSATAGRPKRPPPSRIVVVVVALTLTGATALGLLFLYPASHTVKEHDSFSILLPYNVSQNQCDSLTFGHDGSYTFTTSIPNGNEILLTVTGPTNATEYRGFGYTSIDGTIGASSDGAYEFCLGTTINYPYEGGFAALAGTLTYSVSSPVL